MLLADRTVLLVDPDSNVLESLTVELRSRGAKCFPAGDAAAALWGARETLPDVVVCELELPDRDASSLLSELRALLPSLPAVALTKDRALCARLPEDRSARAPGFEKCLAKPVAASDLVDAICCVLGSGVDQHFAPSLDAIGDALERHDYRRLLAALNTRVPHRYTGLFRFDTGRLTSVWTFDRKNPQIDAFPLEVPIASTPLAHQLEHEHAACIGDTACDTRLSREQRHAEMRAFVAVPLRDDEEGVFGALCHFDPEPRRTDASMLDLLERTAKIFQFTKRRARPK